MYQLMKAKDLTIRLPPKTKTKELKRDQHQPSQFKMRGKYLVHQNRFS